MTRRSVSKQGQSDVTEFKERGLEAAFSINLRIFQSKFGLSNYHYWHFDLNCGSGRNEYVDCIGSPLAFIRAAESVGCAKYFAGFCDTDATALSKLSWREGIVGNGRCFTFHGDNSSLIEAIPDIIAAHERPEYAMGMILSDPNGFDVPLSAMATLATQCPKLDFAINWNSRIRCLFRGNGRQYTDIDDAIAMLNKKHWLIREPRGAHRWTVLVGRNIPVGDHRQLGFYRMDSPKGADIIQQCKAHKQSRREYETASGQLAMTF